MDADGGSGADGQAVAVLDGAVLDEGIGDARLDEDVVVAGVDIAVPDEEIGARPGVDGIGIGGIERRADLHPLDGEIGDVARHEVEHGGVGQGDVGDQKTVAAVDDDEMGPAVDEAVGLGFGHGAGGALGPGPPVGAATVDDAQAGEGDVMEVPAGDARIGGFHLGPDLLLGMQGGGVGESHGFESLGGLDDGPGFEMQVEEGTQGEGSGDEDARWYDEPTASGLLDGGDGLLECVGVQGVAVADGAKILEFERAVGNHRERRAELFDSGDVDRASLGGREEGAGGEQQSDQRGRGETEHFDHEGMRDSGRVFGRQLRLHAERTGLSGLSIMAAAAERKGGGRNPQAHSAYELARWNRLSRIHAMGNRE